MISFLKGKVVEKRPTRLVLDVRGVGYEINIPLSTFQRIPEPGLNCIVLTYLSVKNERMELYGFATQAERELFSALVSVSGIGAKTAISILSGTTVEELRSAVADGDSVFLSSIHGVGKKTAERLIVELRDRFAEYRAERLPCIPRLNQEAISALISLGFRRKAAEQAVERVVKGKPHIGLEDLVREALKIL